MKNFIIIVPVIFIFLTACNSVGRLDEKEMRDIKSIELVKEFNNGWNLGNTLDATNPSLAGSRPEAFETAWGNPVTTPEMIKMVKDAGFNLVRIPVTWDKQIGDAPDYAINPAWMDRVQEVIDYAVDLDLFVIMNLHHEDWHFPSNENFEKAESIIIKVWEQIAKRFENYDERLIFEAMNEPRMKETEFEWTGGTTESRSVVNQLNKAFYETIRNADGNNPLRHLMLPTYAASAETHVLDDLIIPDDDRVIVSVHSYSPYDFALNEAGVTTWSADNPSDTRDIDSLVERLEERYISKGIPVIIGEYGARNKDNLEDRVAWAHYYVKTMEAKGIPRVWWDNNLFVSSGENFGLLNRRTLTWEYPEIVEAIMEASK